jgi:flavin reductase (DIM6/NTAB) family NADH-FMN oxidoreductase RutF
MRAFTKKDFPVSRIRRLLEPGPIVLVSSASKGRTNIMTMGWHTVMEFEPSLVGCMIFSGNHSFGMIKASKECVINIPTFDLAKQVVGIGNCSGAEVAKFEKFKLTPVRGTKVDAPLNKECYANFECKVIDTSLLPKYSFFILEVVKAHAATSPKVPRTVHYRGDGEFMVSGREVSFRSCSGRKIFSGPMMGPVSRRPDCDQDLNFSGYPQTHSRAPERPALHDVFNRECRVSPKEHPMRLIRFSIAAVGLSTLFLGAVVANAVLAPMPAKIGTWTTTVTLN